MGHLAVLAWNDCQEFITSRLGKLGAEKLAKSVLLYVFSIAILASLLPE